MRAAAGRARPCEAIADGRIHEEDAIGLDPVAALPHREQASHPVVWQRIADGHAIDVRTPVRQADCPGSAVTGFTISTRDARYSRAPPYSRTGWRAARL